MRRIALGVTLAALAAAGISFVVTTPGASATPARPVTYSDAGPEAQLSRT